MVAEETISDDDDTNVVKEQPSSCEGPKNSVLCLIMKTKIFFFFSLDMFGNVLNNLCPCLCRMDFLWEVTDQKRGTNS